MNCCNGELYYILNFAHIEPFQLSYRLEQIIRNLCGYLNYLEAEWGVLTHTVCWSTIIAPPPPPPLLACSHTVLNKAGSSMRPFFSAPQFALCVITLCFICTHALLKGSCRYSHRQLSLRRADSNQTECITYLSPTEPCPGPLRHDMHITLVKRTGLWRSMHAQYDQAVYWSPGVCAPYMALCHEYTKKAA